MNTREPLSDSFLSVYSMSLVLSCSRFRNRCYLAITVLPNELCVLSTLSCCYRLSCHTNEFIAHVFLLSFYILHADFKRYNEIVETCIYQNINVYRHCTLL